MDGADHLAQAGAVRQQSLDGCRGQRHHGEIGDRGRLGDNPHVDLSACTLSVCMGPQVWQEGHQWLLRPPSRLRRMGSPQRLQG